jgi:hypothetical protein
MNDQQMELSFGTMGGYRALPRRERRLRQAAWWFQRMRDVVDHTFEWQPAPPPRPEQVWFPGSHRQLAVKPNPEERQICE